MIEESSRKAITGSDIKLPLVRVKVNNKVVIERREQCSALLSVLLKIQKQRYN